MDITKELLEQVLCSPLGACYEDEQAFQLHLKIAKQKITKILGYDIFQLQSVNPNTFTVQYDVDNRYIDLPPYSQLSSVTVKSCTENDLQDLDCDWKPVTRDLVYTAECFNAVERCIGCDCLPVDCLCEVCRTLEISATWCLPEEILLLLAQVLQAKCGDNVRKKSIEGFSVEYWKDEDPLNNAYETLHCYSMRAGPNVA